MRGGGGGGGAAAAICSSVTSAGDRQRNLCLSGLG